MAAKEILLIVDDMIMACETLAEILSLDGYNVKTADSGMKALDIINKEEINFVLTDIKMPKMNGVELLKEIKAVKPEIPVILMTAYSSNQLLTEGIEAGAMQTLHKPLDINNLRMEIAKAVNR